MPIYRTNQFWDYLSNESIITIREAKKLLTHLSYNFDTQSYDRSYYWQTISKLEIDGIKYETIRFPGGLTSWLANKLSISIEEKSYLEYEWDEDEILAEAEKVKLINPDYEIRDYQLEAVETSLNNFRSLINASVGSGKSSMLALTCKCLLKNNEKILILNGNNLILGQLAERLKSFGITDISWEEGKEPDFAKSVVVMNIANSDSHLNRQDEKYISYLKNDVKTIIYDEAHHLQSLTAFEPILYTNPDNLKHLIGYSGSPFRNRKDPYKTQEDFRTVAIIGEPNFNYEMKDAIKAGSIAQPYGYFIRYPNKACFVPKAYEKNYNMQYRANITYNKARNKAGFEMLKFLNQYGIKTFASVNNTKAAQNKMKELKEIGINSLLICGNNTIYEWGNGPRGGLKLEKRKGSKTEVINALSNNYNIIFGTSVLDEGVSIDIFQAAVLFSAGKTNIAGIQRLGRASRKRINGQNVSFVIDFQDIGGYPTFEQHYLERKEMMIDSGIKIFDNVLNFIDFIKRISEENKKD